jgi:hypothetical protein
VLARSVGDTGASVALVGSGSATAYDLVPGGTWTRLPGPPSGTVALGPMTITGALSAPSATRWVKMQTTQVSLAFGSSG